MSKFKYKYLDKTILIGSAFYLLLINIRDFIDNKSKNLSQNLSHFGFSLLILSILFNNLFSSEIITNLKVGEKFDNKKFQIIFNDLKNLKVKIIYLSSNFSIIENNVEEKLEPELRVITNQTS